MRPERVNSLVRTRVRETLLPETPEDRAEELSMGIGHVAVGRGLKRADRKINWDG